VQTEICLVRHGVTIWNYDGRAQGHTDIPLSAEGRQQAEAVAARLGPERWHAIYSSPLSRAYDTAAAIARRTGLTIQTDPRLRERNQGMAEGTSLAERLLRWPGGDWRVEAGTETDESLTDRGMVILTEIAKRHPGQRVLCVAHGGLIAVLLQAMLASAGQANAPVFPGNTSVSRVRYSKGLFTVAALPDNDHLTDGDVQYSGEQYRVRGLGLPFLATQLGGRLSVEMLESAVANATAVETAWVGDQMVALIRCLTDGVWQGYIDLEVVKPGFERALPALIRRLEVRYPNVRFVRTAETPLERTGD
jgi:probable phosphoglycerate mutase